MALVNKGFSEIITFTRASGAGRFNELGVYEWLPANQHRIDHDPATVATSASSVAIGAGLKTFAVSRLYPVGEHVRATADASNWVSGRVVASTGSSVTLWVDRVVGTGTFASWTLIRVLGLLVEESRTNLLLNSATLSTQSVTVTATAHTLAFYGTGTVTLSGAATGTLVGTGANNRVALTFTPTAGSLTLTVSGSVTSADLQAGAFPTSHIPTTSSQVTRAADVASVNELSPWYNASEGAMVADVVRLSTANSSLYQLVNNGSNRLWVRAQITGLREQFVSVVGDVNQALFTPVAVLQHKSAFAYKENDFAVSLNGEAAQVDGSGAVPPGVTQLHVGHNAAASFLNGHIRSLQYFPRRLSNDELQRLTS